MKSQISLAVLIAVFLALCLSNASSSSILPRGLKKRNTGNLTLGQLQSQADDLEKRLNLALNLINRHNSRTSESPSEYTLPPTETKSSTNAPQTEKLSPTPQGTTDSVPGDKGKSSTQKPDKQVSPTTESVPEMSSKPASPTKEPVKQVSSTRPTTTTTPTQSAPGSESSSSTNVTTKEAPPTQNTTISVSVNGTNSSSINNTKITAEGGNQSNAVNNTDKSQRNSTQSFQQTSNFPVIFMVILVAVVAVYFAYHNRNKIHRFIKEGYGKAAKQSGKGYVKVKVDDDIELPREANREYVY